MLVGCVMLSVVCIRCMCMLLVCVRCRCYVVCVRVRCMCMGCYVYGVRYSPGLGCMLYVICCGLGVCVGVMC